MRSSIGAYLLLVGIGVSAARGGPLRAGAAPVDITPAADAALAMGGYGGRTQGFRGIHDDVYVHPIVLDDGIAQVALVAWESLFVPDAVCAETSQRIASEASIRPENLLLSAVHDHGAPYLWPKAPHTQKQYFTCRVRTLRLNVKWLLLTSHQEELTFSANGELVDAELERVFGNHNRANRSNVAPQVSIADFSGVLGSRMLKGAVNAAGPGRVPSLGMKLLF